MAVAGKVNVTPTEEKANDDEPLVYANKLVRIQYVLYDFFLKTRKTTYAYFLSCSALRRQKMHSKHFWNPQMFSLIGPGNR